MFQISNGRLGALFGGLNGTGPTTIIKISNFFNLLEGSVRMN